MIVWLKSPKGRKWVYKVLLALSALAVGYGIIAADTAALWVALGTSLIGFPLADANVDTSEPEDESLGE